MNRTIVKTLLIFFTLFTVYNTLIPFNFTLGPGGLGEALSGVSWGIKYFGKERISLTDVVGNVILFMPFGFLVALYLAMRGKQAAALISAVIASFALSLFIECAQLFIPTRNSAVHDLFHNTLGGAIGAAAALFYMRFLMKTVNRLFSDLYRAQPFSLLLALLGLGGAGMPAEHSDALISLEDVRDLLLGGRLPTHTRVLLEGDWRPGLGTGRAADPRLDASSRGAARRVWAERTPDRKTILVQPEDGGQPARGVTYDLRRDPDEMHPFAADPFTLRRIDTWRRMGRIPQAPSQTEVTPRKGPRGDSP